MTILDLVAIDAATFARLKSDSAGAAVRALLGPTSKADGVIEALDLKKTPLPARPFVAWRAGVVAGQDDEMRRVVGAWWAYDDPPQRWRRINAILAAIAAAYPREWLTYGEMRAGPIGQGAEDSALGGLLTRQITLTYIRRA